MTCHRCGAVRDQAAPQVTSSCSNSRGVAVAASRVCRRAGWALPLGLAKPEQYNLTLHLEPRHFRPAAAAQPVNASAELTLDVMRRTSCLVRGAARCGARCAGARPRPRRAWAPACRCPARGRRAGGAAGAPAPQPRKSTTPVLCAGRDHVHACSSPRVRGPTCASAARLPLGPHDPTPSLRLAPGSAVASRAPGAAALLATRGCRGASGPACALQVVHAAGLHVDSLELTQDFYGERDGGPWRACVCGCAGAAGAAPRNCSDVVRRVGCVDRCALGLG